MDIAAGFKPIALDEVQALADMAKDWKPVFKHA